MVQIKRFAIVSIVTNSPNFISHMVQIKPEIVRTVINSQIYFISHMVQIKPKNPEYPTPSFHTLYPIWFR